jgi:hypothetical protein
MKAIFTIPPSFAYADGGHVGIDIIDADIPYSHPFLFLRTVDIDAQIEPVIGRKLEVIPFRVIIQPV